MPAFSVDVDRHGPIFNGEASAAAVRFVRAAEDEIGKVGVRMVREHLGRVLQHPTGYYESQIRVEQTGEGTAVTDGGVVYGPWLEGTGSRDRTTRFKGYSTFRKIGNAVDRQAQQVAERVLPSYLRRME